MRLGVVLIIGAVLLAACSTRENQSQLLPATPAARTGHSTAGPALKSKLLYVPAYTNDAGGQVIVYKLPLAKHAQPVETINIPEGKSSVASYDALDDDGNLYLSSNTDSQVQVYQPGETTPSRIITDGISHPLGVAVDRTGTLFVANASGYYYYYGTITEYPEGSSSPSNTITGFNNPEGIALDSHSNLWVVNEYVPSYGFQILEVKKGTSTPIVEPLDGLAVPIDIAVDKHDNVYVSDDYYNVVNIYGKGATSPKATITPPNGNYVQSYGLCFSANGKLFVSYVSENQSTKDALIEYSDPLHNPKAKRILTSANGLPGIAGGCAAEKP